MLTELALSNFKALKNVDIKLGRVTVLIGENGSGKSSVLQALAVLKQSLGSGGLKTSGDKIELGSIEDVLHGGNAENQIQVRLRVQTPGDPAEKLLGPDVDATYEAAFLRQNLASHGLLISKPFEVRSFHEVGVKDVIEPQVVAVAGGSVGFESTGRIAAPLNQRALTGVSSDMARSANQAVLGPLLAVVRLLQNTYYVPPIRGIESPWYDQEDRATDEFVTVRGLPSQASSMLSTLTYRKEVETEMSRLTERVLGLRVRTRAIERKRVVAETHDGQTVNIVNEGYGVNQLIHLLAQASVAPNRALLCIEEPEIHLHPAAQGALAGVLANLTYDGEKQILITTHSEHILLALLTYFGRKRTATNDLRVYYFTRDDEAHVASAEPLDLDERGRLKSGLRGFFEANIAELGEYLKAFSGEPNGE